MAAEEDARVRGAVDQRLTGFDEAPEIMMVVRAEDERVVAVNRRCLESFPGRAMVGERVTDAFPDLAGQQVLDLWAECLRTGEPQEGHHWRLGFADPDGTLRTVWMDFRITPVRDAGGRVVAAVSRAADCTERVLSEAAEDQRRSVVQRELDLARGAVRDLQEALLPAALPVVAGLDVAARYLIAAEGVAAGGDWFDVVPRPGGSRVALVVGDVVGHGLPASAAMGELRAVLHERLAAGALLADAVSALTAYAAGNPATRAATACVVDLDLGTGELDYVTAGHPPPLVVSAVGPAYFLEATGGRPLGVPTRDGVRTRSTRLGRGDVVALYSDGLVQRPRFTVQQHTVALVETAREAVHNPVLVERGPGRTVDRVCEVAMENLVRVSGYSDDLTLLVAQRRDPPAPLHQVLLLGGGKPHRLMRTVLERAEAWLEDLGVQPAEVIPVQYALGELLTNALTHPYRTPEEQRDGRVEVTLELEETSCVCLTVRDDGRWRPSRRDSDPTETGLATASAMVDDLVVTAEETGTTVVARTRVSRRAVLLDEWRPEPGPGPALDHVDGVRVRLRGATVEVTGRVDNFEALELQEQLRSVLVTGAVAPGQSLLVDLSGVTHLGSRGVQVLHELLPRIERGDARLLAPLGSVAQHVLELADLPYVVRP